MQLRLGRVTLLGAQFQPPKIVSQSDLRRRWPHVGLCPELLVEINSHIVGVEIGKLTITICIGSVMIASYCT